VQRARIVLYAAEGMADTEIARQLDTSPGLVGPVAKTVRQAAVGGAQGQTAVGSPAAFPLTHVAAVKAVARELPIRYGLPLSRFSRTELHRLVLDVSEASASSVWRRLHDAALKPWQQRSWIYRRDPEFEAKAARVLDLYARVFCAKRLWPNGYVICTDEKSQLPALGRPHETSAPAPGRRSRYESEYQRGGTPAYLAAWDVHHAKLFDRVEDKTGIEPFGRLFEQVMTAEPYASANTVYWIVDNGSIGRRPSLDPAHADAVAEHPADPPAGARLVAKPDRAVLLGLQRKALTPNDQPTLDELAERVLAFGHHHRQVARPFQWTFTRQDLHELIARIDRREPQLALVS
jgi:hypothetical protein